MSAGGGTFNEHLDIAAKLQRWVSDTSFDLSGAAVARAAGPFSKDYPLVIYSVQLIYSEASSSNAGVRVAVGHATDLATPVFDDDSICSITSEVSKNLWTKTVATLLTTIQQINNTKTLGRPVVPKNCPVIITADNSKTGAGEVQVVIEFFPLDQ